jgi:hypothetical protein
MHKIYVNFELGLDFYVVLGTRHALSSKWFRPPKTFFTWTKSEKVQYFKENFNIFTIFVNTANTYHIFSRFRVHIFLIGYFYYTIKNTKFVEKIVYKV